MAYGARTEVSVHRSIGEIVAMVKKAGADQIGQLESNAMIAIQFTMADRMIRFRVALPIPPEMPDYDGRNRRLTDQQKVAMCEQGARQKARALMLVIKAKLESVESQVETFEEAFLANVVTSDGSTIYERIKEPIALEYQTGKPAMMLLGGPNA